MQTRVGYNDKARGLTAGGKKKGKRRSQPSEASSEQVDPNATIHVPRTMEEMEMEKKERLKQELAAQSDSKMNSKKKKRLEKYIEKKLKKEERLVLFEKLSQSQAQLPTTLHLQSSSTLGTGKASTHKERLEKLEDTETRRAIEGRAGKRKRGRDRFDVLHVDDDDYSEVDEDIESGEQEKSNVQAATTAQEDMIIDSESTARSMAQPAQSMVPGSSAVGSALQRNPDGSIVAPRITKKKKGKKTTFSGWNLKRSGSVAQPTVEGDSDTSFDSSDSAFDNQENDGDDKSESGEEDSDNTEGEDEKPSKDAPPTKKRLGFKDWALQQLSAAKGYTPTTDTQNAKSELLPSPLPAKKQKIDHPRQPAEMRGPLGEDLQLPSTSLTEHLQQSKRSKAVTVARPPEVEEARLLLPIVTEEQPIMEAVLLNHVVIICGETGSGKTTQVPQFLYEAGFGNPGSDNPGMIGVTQPRRVAAMSMTNRVAHELSLTSSRVSYQIRYDATVSPSTSIKFMTDGVLLRELATDFLLNKYSVIIIDEAHERSMNTDILIGVLSRVLKLREQLWKEGKEGAKPLRLIIMSATLRVSDFAENQRLFPSAPPIINVAARQHPVTVHFSRRTRSDYVTEAIKKASKIHSRLPPGGILIFLTGQNEITGVCRKLEAKFGQKALEARRQRRRTAQPRPRVGDNQEEEQPRAVASAHADVEAEDIELGTEEVDLAFDIDEGMGNDDPEALDSDDEQPGENEELGIDVDETETPMHIIPLYSLLSSDKQMRVFQAPPAGHRLVVVSTNVAETSLTIPGIRYVIDCGRSKERRYDVANGIQAFQVSWISKASAAQRAGRAGRTGPGHCYRLYSSALFEHYFDAFSRPEILRMPIEGVVLQMKSMHIDAVVNFPFPTPPDQFALKKAETVLTHLGAVSVSPIIQKGSMEVLTATIGGHITDLGKAMSLFPLSPRFSRMLVGGRQHGCLPYVVSIISALSVGDPFLREDGIDDDGEESDEDVDGALSHLHNEAVRAKEVRKLRRQAFFQSQQTHASLGNATSDLFRLLSIVGAYEYAGGGHKFCAEHFVRPKAMEEIHKLRAQISSIVQTNFPALDAGFVPKLQPPNDLQLKVLKQLLTAAFIDQVAIRKDLVQKGSSTCVKYATSRGVEYKAMGISEDVFIHPSSVLASAPPPEYIAYNEVVQSSRIWVKGLTVINPAWLSSLGKPSLCTFSKPIKNSTGSEIVIPRFGPERWELPPLKADM